MGNKSIINSQAWGKGVGKKKEEEWSRTVYLASFVVPFVVEETMKEKFGINTCTYTHI